MNEYSLILDEEELNLLIGQCSTVVAMKEDHETFPKAQIRAIMKKIIDAKEFTELFRGVFTEDEVEES